MTRDNRPVAVITGAGQGLGRAFALDLADRGWLPAILDLNGERASRVAAEITERAGRARAYECDVTSQADVANVVSHIADRAGPIVGLVNNAAVFSTLRMEPFDQIGLDVWEHVLKVNVTGVFIMCQAIIPRMRADGYGKVVNISSGTVLSGRPNYLHYVTSKAAIIGLTRSLAAEVGPHGITVNTITPGSTVTEIERETVTPEQRQVMTAATALGRVQVPGDITGAVAFLLSHDSDFITGQTLNVDGGFAYH